MWEKNENKQKEALFGQLKNYENNTHQRGGAWKKLMHAQLKQKLYLHGLYQVILLSAPLRQFIQSASFS